jgi:hypothetical protein
MAIILRSDIRWADLNLEPHHPKCLHVIPRARSLRLRRISCACWYLSGGVPGDRHSYRDFTFLILDSQILLTYSMN